MNNYGKCFINWRNDSGILWNEYVEHLFVEQLANGDLSSSAFLKYLTQDYLFLLNFSRAWALGVTKSETIDEMRPCAATVHSLVNEEIQLHIALCADAGILESDLKSANEETANLSYTLYVLDAGHSGDLLDLLAALAPCVLGYGEIGLRLQSNHHSSRYENWIQTYGGKDYQEVCVQVGQLIDNAVARRLGNDPVLCPRWIKLTERFCQATRLEIGFWEMGLSI